MREEWNDLFLGIIFFLISLAIYFIVIPNQVYQMGGSGLSPRFFPSVTTLAIAGSSLCLIFRKWKKIRKVNQNRKVQWEISLVDKRDFRVLITITFLILFVLLFKYFSFLLAAIVTLIPMIRFFGEKRILLNIVISVLVSISVFYFFENALHIVLH